MSIIENFKETDLVELYTSDTAEDTFSLGYILKEFDDYILFKGISEYGTFLNYQLRKKDIIKKIVSQSEYIDAFNFYISYNKKIDGYDIYDLENKLWEINSFYELLEDCYKNNISIISEDEEFIITGEVIFIDKEKIIILDKDIHDFFNPIEIEIKLKTITGIDIINIENHLLGEYESAKHN